MSDFKTITEHHPRDKDLAARSLRLAVLKAVLDGSFYDVLPHRFHEEDGFGGYIPLHHRAPAVHYGLNMLRTVVEDSVSFLFGEGRFPLVDCEDVTVRETLADIVKESKLVQIMRDAALRGSIGSVAIQMRYLSKRIFFQVFDTVFLTPEYDPTEPDKLMRVVEKYKVKGSDLADMGYSIKDDMLKTDHWFMRVFDGLSETWYQPWPISQEAAPRIDSKRTVNHNLGFCPFVWIKNLPGGDDLDGACTFTAGLDTAIAIDYQLSQAGRALKYSADPLLLLKSPTSDGPIVRSSSNALVVDKDGDAKLLEIAGTATAAAVDYVKTLREYLLETIHGNRTNADKIGSSHVSSAAMKMLYHPLIQLADNLRASYGEDGLLTLMRMVLKAADRVPIRCWGQSIDKLNPNARLSLRWPDYFPLTPADRQLEAATLGQLRDNGMMSRETAVKVTAPSYNIEDTRAELSKIAADETAQDARLAEQSAQVKASETVSE